MRCCRFAWVSRSGCCCLSGARGRLLCFGFCPSLRRGLGSRRPCAGSAGAGELSAAPPGRVPLRGAKRALLRSFRAPPLPVLSPFVPRAPGWAVGAGSLCVSSAFVLVSGAAAGGGCPPAGRAPGCGSPAAGGLRGVAAAARLLRALAPPVNTPAAPCGSPLRAAFPSALRRLAAVLRRRRRCVLGGLRGRLSAFFRGVPLPRGVYRCPPVPVFPSRAWSIIHQMPRSYRKTDNQTNPQIKPLQTNTPPHKIVATTTEPAGVNLSRVGDKPPSLPGQALDRTILRVVYPSYRGGENNKLKTPLGISIIPRARQAPAAYVISQNEIPQERQHLVPTTPPALPSLKTCSSNFVSHSINQSNRRIRVVEIALNAGQIAGCCVVLNGVHLAGRMGGKIGIKSQRVGSPPAVFIYSLARFMPCFWI